MRTLAPFRLESKLESPTSFGPASALVAAADLEATPWPRMGNDPQPGLGAVPIARRALDQQVAPFMRVAGKVLALASIYVPL
jgi:hypothetical protein